MDINVYNQSLESVIEDSKQNYDRYGFGYLFLAFDYYGAEYQGKTLKRRLKQVFSLNPEFVSIPTSDTNYRMCYFHRDNYSETAYGKCDMCGYKTFPIHYFYNTTDGTSKVTIPLNNDEIIRLNNNNVNTLYVGITTIVGITEAI